MTHRGWILENSQKIARLQEVIRKYGKMLIAFSGGVDSSLLLAVAWEVLKDNVLAVTGVSPIHPKSEIEKAIRFAKSLGVSHRVLPSHEMDLADFLENNPERCYFCKKSLVLDLQKIAEANSIPHIADGSNLDDLKDYRPGFKAAKELGIVSPLVEAGLTKKDIRNLSKDMGLETWDQPSQPCLATRLPYGTPITEDVLLKVARAEAVLSSLGIPVSRVRHHGELARIEVPAEVFQEIMKEEARRLILDKFREIGYLYIALDLGGYFQGSMNRAFA
ncbi:MAG: ATP-dependent sacrificial sulfur transferase LarE [Proteobacteria bacterium]|nr:ATP-dependent sacrificial sulfur transferase LarE [Pseudomonadota bacterium]MBU4053553.1 ATP-dependent sacrificial sulfur transferase LarE [Pseudomonadota bacterium]